MDELDGSGMEKNAPTGIGSAGPVLQIPFHRASDGSQLRTDLMGPAGYKLYL
jgi:hypothetical protein